MLEIIESLLRIDVLIHQMASQFGVWLYVILFLIIFAETGLVVMPFLPGDSLLFAVGALSATSEHFQIQILIPLLICASIIGDSVNYFIGQKYGRKLFETQHRFSKIFNQKYLIQTEEFFIRKGAVAVFISRFLPILRTFAPFVAGLSQMNYRKFLKYSVSGSFVWVNVFVLAGHFFGRIPFIQKNFTLLVMGIIVFSLAPMLFGVLRSLIKKRL
jgi:membrane-associated protein